MLRTMMSGSVARSTSSARRATDASAPGTVRSEIEEIGDGACAIGTQIIGLRRVSLRSLYLESRTTPTTVKGRCCSP